MASIEYEISGRIATITVNNPPLNVFTHELHRELFDVLLDFNANGEGTAASSPEQATVRSALAMTSRPSALSDLGSNGSSVTCTRREPSTPTSTRAGNTRF